MKIKRLEYANCSIILLSVAVSASLGGFAGLVQQLFHDDELSASVGPSCLSMAAVPRSAHSPSIGRDCH